MGKKKDKEKGRGERPGEEEGKEKGEKERGKVGKGMNTLAEGSRY